MAAVAGNADGDLVVVWESTGSSGSDLSSWSIQRQRYRGIGVSVFADGFESGDTSRWSAAVP